MDDLSINITGLGPAAARALKAVSPQKPRKTAKGGKGKASASKWKDAESKTSNEGKGSRAEGKAKGKGSKPRAKETMLKVAMAAKAAKEAKEAKEAKKAKEEAQEASEPRPAKRKAKGQPGAVLGKSPKPKKPKMSKDDPDLKASGVVSETKFTALKLHESLLRQLEYLGFNDCTPIQALAVPRAVTGKKDLLLRAPTGSGKTLAFLVPVLHQLLKVPGGIDRRKGTLATILSPTKELALQTLKVASDLARMLPSVVCGAVAGGEKPKSEKARLRKGLVVLCATPGRLAYHLEHTATFVVRNIKCLVLDEADRLLDMGFEPQIRSIHKKLMEEAKEGENGEGSVQSMLVSATLVPAVQQLANFCLRPKAFWADAEGCVESAGGASGASGTVSVGNELNFAAPSTLTQWYCVVPGKERLAMLLAALLRVGKKKSIVFLSTGASVDFHCDLLADASWPPRGGISRREAKPKIKKISGSFIGLAKDAKHLQDEDDEDEDDGEEGEEGTETDRVKMFSKTQIFKLHGSLSKEERAGHMADFAKSAGGVLLASDAASRGLDFPRIDWIVQYDPPQRTEEYLHRVGRTARIGKAGSALLFLQPSELGFLDVLRGRGLTELREMSLEDLSAGLQQKAPSDLHGVRDIQGLIAGHLASRVAAQAPLASRARSGFLASLKAYRSFPRELRSCFPFSQLHLGHLATSFALREAPRDVVKKDRYERTAEPEALKKGKARAERQKGGKKRGKGEGKGKGGKGGKSGKGGKGGKGGPGMKARPGKSPGVNAADEFAS